MKAKRTMRQKTSPKVRQKLTLVYAAAGMAIAALVGVGLFIYINLGNNEDSMAANADYYSIKSGFWTEKIWNNGIAPTNNIKGNIEIFKYVTHVGGLNYASGTLTVTDTLVITGDLNMGTLSYIVVNPGGILVIGGNFNSQNKVEVKNGGVIAVKGDMIFPKNGHDIYDGTNGDLYVIGTVNGNTDAGRDRQDGGALQKDHPAIFSFFNGESSTLPITLSYFKVTEEQGRVIVSWETDMEENNDYFSVERSADGKTFEQAATVAGAGSSTSKLVYSYTDSKALPGTSYYRLKQTDYDGKFTYSRIESVSRSASGMFASVLHIEVVAPNPFTDNFFMSYTLPSDGQVEVRLVNMQGIVAFSEKVEGFEGQNQYEFYDRKGLKSGTYLLRLSHKNVTSKVERLIKR